MRIRHSSCGIRRTGRFTGTMVDTLPEGFVGRASSFAQSTGRAPRVCEVNTRPGAPSAALLCKELGEGCEFIGITFLQRRANADLSRKVRRLLHNHSAQMLSAGPALLSARAILHHPAAATLPRSCDVLVLHMDAPSAEGRQTLIVDLSAAMELARLDAPTMLIMIGRHCDAPSSSTYTGAWGSIQSERCWRHAWRKMETRRDILDSHCTSSTPDGWIWCTGRLAPTSACTPDHPALLETALAATRHLEARSACKVSRDVVTFPKRLLAPEWKLLVPQDNTTSASVDDDDEPSLLSTVRSFVSIQRRVMRRYRYYSLMHCGLQQPRVALAPPELCLLFKNDVAERWVAMITSTDGGRTFGYTRYPQLVLPVQTRNNSHLIPTTMTHNAAFASIDGGSRFAVIGGRFGPHFLPLGSRARPGVYMATGLSLRWSTATEQSPRYAGRGQYYLDAAPQSTQWRDFRLIFNGTHPGCVERRPRAWTRADGSGACEFDGRLSLVEHNGELVLFARANSGASGLRFVQATRSKDNGRSWSPFSQLHIEQWAPSNGDLYFFSVQPNPVHNGSLVAMVPVVHHFSACVSLTFSVDGLRWSPLSPLVRCAAYGERSAHHPVSGGLVRVSQERIALLVHESVPYIYVDKRTPEVLRVWLEDAKVRGWRHAGSGTPAIGAAAKHGPEMSQLVRYEFGCGLLAQWTRKGLQALRDGTRRDGGSTLDEILANPQRFQCSTSRDSACPRL